MRILFRNPVILAGVILLGAIATAQGKDVFGCNVEIIGKKTVFRCGENIPVRIKTQYPSKYIFCGWNLFAYVRSLPEDFARITKKKVKTSRDPKWSSIQIRAWTWLPYAQRTGKTATGSISTKGFPPGDYELSVTTLFQRKNKADKLKDVYTSGRFVVTLE